ncbi:MAG TPA: hypothetical protein VF806_02790 [Anaerolineaceae bacterium]
MTSDEPAQDLDAFPAPENGINVYNEKSLHAALKQWYLQPDDHLEVKVDGYIIDLVRGEQLVEIQTGSFSPLKYKLAKLARSHTVRLVFPIAQEKWIIRLPGDTQEKPQRRKSPKRGQVEQVFKELVYIPALIQNENFSLEVLLIREEELRRHEANKAWRRRGWVTQERRLLEVIERQVFQTPYDLARLLPASLPDPFTARELAKAAGQPDWLARKMIYCFKVMGIIALKGKRGRSLLYTRA